MEFLLNCLSTSNSGHLTIGGADIPALAREYGTPLYLMDESAIRERCREFKAAFSEVYGDRFMVKFAGKAFCVSYMYKILMDEQLGADVASGGELFTAMNAGFPPEKICFHGNNKTEDEIKYAIKCGVRCFAVDNREELIKLDRLSREHNTVSGISFRIKPGVDAHTHEFIRTGQIDSKFGVAVETGEALKIIRTALKLPNVKILGIHCHIGSQIFETEPFVEAAGVMMKLISEVKDKMGYTINELNLGGGFGIKYTGQDDPPAIRDMAAAIAGAVKKCAAEYGIPEPFLIVEPGRSVVADSGVTVYTVGSVKYIPGIRTYVTVDGGMTDNPRYALYGSKYEALLPERPKAPVTGAVTLAGHCCESGDILGENIELPDVFEGDLVAVLSTGAYNYSMASNYNRTPRPPVVMVRDGEAKLVVRRETYEDIISCDIL